MARLFVNEFHLKIHSLENKVLILTKIIIGHILFNYFLNKILFTLSLSWRKDISLNYNIVDKKI